MTSHGEMPAVLAKACVAQSPDQSRGRAVRTALLWQELRCCSAACRGIHSRLMVEDRMCGRACDSHLRLHVGGYTQSSRYRQTGRPRSVSTSASVTRPPRARNADGISSERVAQLRTGTLKARHHGFHSVYLVCPNGTAEAEHRCSRGDPGPAPLARRHCNSEGWRLRPATLSVAEQRSRDRPPYPTQPR